MGMKKNVWTHILGSMLLAGCIGGAAGVIGASVTTAHLSDYLIGLGQIDETRVLVQPRPRTIPGSYEAALTRLEESVFPAIGVRVSAETLEASGFLKTIDLTTVIALTSDGWGMAAHGSVGDSIQFGVQTCIVDAVIEEPRLGMRFLHCAIANSPVVDLGESNEIAGGDQLFIIEDSDTLVFTQARDVVWGESVRSSDTPTRRIRLSDQAVPVGAGVFNVSGEFVGMTLQEDGEVVVIPFSHWSHAFGQVLEYKEKISYPSLGVRGIHLTEVVGTIPGNTSEERSGFLIYGSRGVSYGSAAYTSGFVIGDILLAVDGTMIDETHSLDDLLTAYSPGDVIQIEFVRTGERQRVDVTLGELAL
jgi:hypothetical protein